MAANDPVTKPTANFSINVEGELNATLGLKSGGVSVVSTTRTINGKALGEDVSLTASDVGALPLTGGTLTGDLVGEYITGTWLRTTFAGHLSAAATKIAVLDTSGWIYYRTAAELLGDLGAATMNQVNAAIDAAITGAINASY